METLRERITFILTACTYLLFHLRIGGTPEVIFMETLGQLLTTAPYCIGFTYILIVIIRYLHQGRIPAWDRIGRIYFTIGIFFALFFALYEYNERTLAG